MSFIYVNPSVVNATCINIADLKDVTMMNFVAQIIGTVCTVLSMTMVCFMYWRPCCKKNKISPEEAFMEFIRTRQTTQPV
jgi:hypothetical protein